MSGLKAHAHARTYILTLQREKKKNTISLLVFMCQISSAKTNPYYRPLTINTHKQTCMFIQTRRD